jgi:peroxiredoxin family protein
MNSVGWQESVTEQNETIEARLRELEAQVAALARAQRQPPAGLTIIAFSNDMDKLLAAFTLATGAAAMGMSVSMFFTFWALAALKRKTIFKGKRGVEKVLTAILPAGAHRLGVSKWNLLGLGRIFLEARMRRRHVESLRNLVALARELDVRMVACETSMELMAVTKDELVEGVGCGGVATCLDAAFSGAVTLFI